MSNNKATILITGAAGFLGTWMADECHKKGFDLIGIDLRVPFEPQIWSNFSTSSCATADFEQLIAGKKLLAVLHLAGSASVGFSVSDPFSDFASLLPGTARLALYLARHQPQARLFFFSSAAVYGNPLVLPIKEEAPIIPISPYGIHKATAENLLSHYSRIFNLRLTILRIFSVYGPGLRKQLVWDVYQKSLSAMQAGEQSITLFGTGNESRDFIYVKDVCDAVLSLLSYSSNEYLGIYNLASGIETTIKDAAHYIIKHLGGGIEIKFDGKISKGDPANWSVDTKNLSSTGFTCRYTLEEGLGEVEKWIKTIK